MKYRHFPEHLSQTFIETGSYMGRGIQEAIKAGFENIISIEISDKYHSICSNKFKNNKNVEIVLGDSYKVLPSILSKINHSVTFWLDGHHSCGDTGIGDFWAPLIQELESIKNHHINSHTIMIDDMNCWEEENIVHGFTTIDIRDSLNSINPNYRIENIKESNILIASL